MSGKWCCGLFKYMGRKNCRNGGIGRCFYTRSRYDGVHYFSRDHPEITRVQFHMWSPTRQDQMKNEPFTHIRDRLLKEPMDSVAIFTPCPTSYRVGKGLCILLTHEEAKTEIRTQGPVIRKTQFHVRQCGKSL